MGLSQWSSAGLAAIVVAFLFFVHARFYRWRSRHSARIRNQNARKGEILAESLLKKNGYRIVERQAVQPWDIFCDNDIHTVELRADLLVEKGGEVYVAEVKTGNSAPDLYNASTRRQLLEYSLAYDVDGVLLVDVEREAVQQVRFLSAASESAEPHSR